MIQQVLRFILPVGQIVHAHGDHPDRARDQLLGPTAFAAMALHVVHLTVKFVTQPLGESRFGDRKIDVTDADLLKTESIAPANDVGFERRHVLGSDCG